jgi:co-chaperonin GroES (HSP10)
MEKVMSEIKVHNKRVLVQLVEKEQKEKGFFLMPETAEDKSEWTLALAIDVAREEDAHLVDRMVLFPTHMLETFEHGGETFHFVQENYIVASFAE